MKPLSILVLFGCLVWTFGATAQVTRGTIAFVDYEQVFTNYFKAKLANDQLQGMIDTINRERAIMLIQFDKLQEELKEMRARLLEEELNESARQILRRRIDAKLVEIRKLEDRVATFNESQSKRWEEQNRRIRGNLMEEIQEKMAVFLKARGYLAVVDRSQTSEKGVPAVLYLDERADITRDVIAEINK